MTTLVVGASEAKGRLLVEQLLSFMAANAQFKALGGGAVIAVAWLQPD